MEALLVLEKEKNISRDVMLDAIENSLIMACKNQYGKADNVLVDMNRETGDFHVYLQKNVVSEVNDKLEEISLEDAHNINAGLNIGDVCNVEIQSKEFGRIVTQTAKNTILQKIREEERRAQFDEYLLKQHEVVTGVVQRYVGKNVKINLGKIDATLTENEMIKGESFNPTDHVKVYVLEVKPGSKGPQVLVSRTHPEFVKKLLEAEVPELQDGTVVIKGISREPGSRTKLAVYSNNSNVDPVGACVGSNGSRVSTIVDELKGEKLDVFCWDENPAILIENALSPAKVISVIADGDSKTAKVVVPDYQLSLAIGKEGQNARLAAKLTGFKIDIKNETKAREDGDILDYDEYDEYDEEYDEEYEDYDEEYEEYDEEYDEYDEEYDEEYEKNNDVEGDEN